MWMKGAKARGSLPGGNLKVFAGEAGGVSLITVAFEKGGKMLQLRGRITLTLPADLPLGAAPALIGPDGAETPAETNSAGAPVLVFNGVKAVIIRTAGN